MNKIFIYFDVKCLYIMSTLFCFATNFSFSYSTSNERQWATKTEMFYVFGHLENYWNLRPKYRLSLTYRVVQKK